MLWLDRHLWGRPDTANRALADNSPLAAALNMRTVARDGRWFGVRVGGVLAPEVVARAGIQVGRFEVTRAQWTEFDSSYAIEPGTENHPVGGITFDRALAYAAWLAQRTGLAYRLPTKAERDALGGTGGNTLDHWAGYAVNPDDMDRLRSLINALPGDAPLLREAGTSGDATGDPPIYDLGGNVAEWTTAPDGSGVVAGASADRPKDSTSRPGGAAPAYLGLRVVIGSARIRDL
jgi:formylglycine-generating enzyme required for sulfatase activity